NTIFQILPATCDTRMAWHAHRPAGLARAAVEAALNEMVHFAFERIHPTKERRIECQHAYGRAPLADAVATTEPAKARRQGFDHDSQTKALVPEFQAAQRQDAAWRTGEERFWILSQAAVI